MTQGPTQIRPQLLGGVLAALLVAGLASSSGLVFCIGADGHRALEREHASAGCPTLAGSRATASFISVSVPAECFDVPAVGASTAVVSSPVDEKLPDPPMVLLGVRLAPPPPIQARPAGSPDSRAGPPHLAVHLRSTVLLV